MFNKPKPRTFNYKSRFSDADKSDLEFKKQQQNDSISRAFNNKKKPKRVTLPLLLIVLIAIIAFMYYLDIKLR
jgi:hypothetical protein